MLIGGPNTNQALRPSDPFRPFADEVDIDDVVSGQDPIISLSQAKDVLHVYHDRDDVYIQSLAKGVIAQVEKYIGLDVVRKVISARWYRPSVCIHLPRGPHGDIESVKVFTHDGTEKTLVADVDYTVTGSKFKTIWRRQAISWGQLEVKFESGYQVSKMPDQIVGGVLQEINLQYKNRKDPDTPEVISDGALSIEARHLLDSVPDKRWGL